MILKKSRRDVPLCINDGNVGHMDKRLLLNLPPHDVAHQCNAMQLTHWEIFREKFFICEPFNRCGGTYWDIGICSHCFLADTLTISVIQVRKDQRSRTAVLDLF